MPHNQQQINNIDMRINRVEASQTSHDVVCADRYLNISASLTEIKESLVPLKKDVAALKSFQSKWAGAGKMMFYISCVLAITASVMKIAEVLASSH